METPQFTNRIKKDIKLSQNTSPDYILCAPKKNQTKKTISIKRNMMLSSEYSSELKKLDYNSSPKINQIIFSHARYQQDKSPYTPAKKDCLYENEKESTIVQSHKRKYIDKDISIDSQEKENHYFEDENKSITEKKYTKNERIQNQINSLYNKKRLKPILPFRSSIKFSSDQQEQSIFNLYRDKDIHTNIGTFNETYKKDIEDSDYSDEEQIDSQIQEMTDNIVSSIQNKN